MSVGKPDQDSIRPQVHSTECSGLDVEVGYGVQAESTQEKAVLSFEDEAPVKVQVDNDEIEAIDEEEEKRQMCLYACQHNINHHVQSSWTTA